MSSFSLYLLLNELYVIRSFAFYINYTLRADKVKYTHLRICRRQICFQHQHQLAELNKKQLEQAMQQLQEQLQLNLFQQTHLLQTADKKKASAPLQQLAIQQQQLIQQLQITQRQYLLQQGLSLQGHTPSSGIYTSELKMLD